MSNRPKKLLDRVRDVLRDKHYSIHTERTYVDWIKRYILFHHKRHPRDMAAPEIETFLVHLAVDLNVAASTQNQALSALLFLYREVLEIDPEPVDAIRAKRPRRLPNVLTREQVLIVLDALSGVNQLIARLLYGSGLRLIECLRLRVQDVDFDYRQIVVHDGKGRADHVTMLPDNLLQPLHAHLRHVKTLHRRDLDDGYGAVYLPVAIEEEHPDAHREWGWQYLFPAPKLSIDPRSGIRRRHHLGESGPQKAVRKAAQSVGIDKPINCHTLRHCFATHLLESGYDIRTVQQLLGHADVETTLIYSHVLNRGGPPVRSPLD
jgi:integron integrase